MFAREVGDAEGFGQAVLAAEQRLLELSTQIGQQVENARKLPAGG
jgi:hypothetical protein